MVLDTFDIIMTDIRIVRLCACGGHILTLSIADRRPVRLRADGFGYVRRRHDGYQACPLARVWLSETAALQCATCRPVYFTRGWLGTEPERFSARCRFICFPVNGCCRFAACISVFGQSLIAAMRVFDGSKASGVGCGALRDRQEIDVSRY